MTDKILYRYIKGEASLEEKKQVILWIHDTDENKKRFLEYRKFYNIIIWQKRDVARIKEQNSQSKSFRFFIYFLKIAGIFLLPFGLSYFWLSSIKEDSDTLYQTLNVPSGQRAELVLADGTNVWLNANSSLTFPTKFHKNNRTVILRGEAYFDVYKNTEQPFLVQSGNYTIKVLGTQFNVQAYVQNSLFETDLIEGSVEVLNVDNNKLLALTPGNKVKIEKGEYTVSPITDYNYYLWKDGLICFDDILLRDLFKQLEQYFDVKINVVDKSQELHKYTGKFRAKDGVEHILKTLQLNNSLKYRRDEKHNTIEIY